MFLTFLERVNLAANAVIVQQAAAARLLMASQALAECREANNPYLPGNSLLGPSRAQMWGPDPCLTQEKELAAATIDNQAAQSAAQIAGASDQATPTAAVAPQLTETWDFPGNDPAVPITEFETPSPALSNMWSPDSLLEIMEMIANQLEQDQEGSTQENAIIEELEIIRKQMIAFLQWQWQDHPKPRKHRFQYLPKNQKWIGRWVPE